MLKIGSDVHWESQAGGFSKVKSGVVEEVIPPNTYLTHEQKKKCNASSGAIRKTVSYIIRVPSETGKGNGKAYWPNQNLLKPGPHKEASNDVSLSPEQLLSVELNKILKKQHTYKANAGSSPLRLAPGQIKEILDKAGLVVSLK